ncbi:hypothetical protein [Saccharicrinis aurantiacus]|uniref:hypothetical protein n=1 Tax=Saccharicrinis aurantiacus TaxID=1849719 RepID=UPI0024900692|nr:hypothetical protein [Saccharicrinis aurantiacus]
MQKENEYSAKMTTKSEAELYEYINNENRYQEGAIVAAIWELEKRGVRNEALVMLESKLDGVLSQKKANSIIDTIAEDAQAVNLPAPELYSPFFMRIFGVLFSVFGGSILMAINFSRLGKKDIARNVVLAGLAYSLLQGVVLNFFGPSATILSVPASLGGVYLMEHWFWNKHVPSSQVFVKRSFLPPVLFAITIAMLLVYLMIENGIALQ